MVDRFLEGLNFVFDNDFVRMFTVVLTGIWAGYLLQPVPKWLNNLFDTSHIFKFVVLVFIGLGMTSPITLERLVTILLTATTISVLFAFMRYYDRQEGSIPTIFDTNAANAANANANAVNANVANGNTVVNGANNAVVNGANATANNAVVNGANATANNAVVNGANANVKNTNTANANATINKNVTRPSGCNEKPANSQSGGSCYSCGTYLPYETGASF